MLDIGVVFGGLLRQEGLLPDAKPGRVNAPDLEEENKENKCIGLTIFHLPDE